MLLAYHAWPAPERPSRQLGSVACRLPTCMQAVECTPELQPLSTCKRMDAPHSGPPKRALLTSLSVRGSWVAGSSWAVPRRQRSCSVVQL